MTYILMAIHAQTLNLHQACVIISLYQIRRLLKLGLRRIGIQNHFVTVGHDGLGSQTVESVQFGRLNITGQAVASNSRQ